MVNHTSSNLKSSRIRPDGIEKVTGSLSYLTDLQFSRNALRKGFTQ